MTPFLFISIALAGGVGSAGRLVLDGVIRSRTRDTAPWGTLTINLTGSLLFGFITGLATSLLLPEHWYLILSSGFLGGYTTFSTASFETIRMLQKRRWVAGFLNGLGALVATTCLAGLGLWLGTLPNG